MIKKFNEYINEGNNLRPYKACTWLRGFIDRIDRLKEDKYSNPRFRTYDLSRLENELKKIDEFCEVALNNKNADEAEKLVNKAKSYLDDAKKLLK